MKNTTLIIILLIFLNFLILGLFGFWFYTEKIAKPSPSPSPISTSQPTTAPAWQPTIAPTLLPTATPQAKSDLELLKEAFAEKYSKPIGDVTVNISENTGTHATGGVKFAGEMGGAMWLAYFNGTEWIIVHDGHGTIPCDPIESYNFPTDMVPECWDEASNTLINRT